MSSLFLTKRHLLVITHVDCSALPRAPLPASSPFGPRARAPAQPQMAGDGNRPTADGSAGEHGPVGVGPTFSTSMEGRLWLLRRACVIRPDTNTNTHEHARTKLTRPGLSPGSAWGHVGNRTGVGRAPAASQARSSRNTRRESAATAPAEPLAKGSRQRQAVCSARVSIAVCFGAIVRGGSRICCRRGEHDDGRHTQRHRSRGVAQASTKSRLRE